jgi:amidase
MRRFLVALLALALFVPTTPSTAAPSAGSDPVDCLRVLEGLDLQHVTIPQLQAALDGGLITSRQLVERYLDRIAAFDFDEAGPQLNGVRELHPDVLAQADLLDAERQAGIVRGPMHGIPVLFKDNIGTNDMPTTAGSIALEGSIPAHDAFLIERLRAEGAIILGKAEMAEFANWMDPTMPNGFSSLGGQVRNSYNLSRNPSGSSSGSATSAAMAYATLTVGSETSGSILSPSEVQGLAAVKPTVGLVSRSGVIPLAPSWDTTGPMARNVTDAAIWLGATVGTDERDPATAASATHLPEGNDYRPSLDTQALEGARLGVQNRRGLNAVMAEAVDELERQGATIVDIEHFNEAKNVGLSEFGAVSNEFKTFLNGYLATEADPPSGVKTLADIIAFNEQHPDRIPYGQKWLQVSQTQPGIEASTVPNSVVTTASSQAVIDQTLARYDLDAIVSTGVSNANIGAAAGYPTVAVPAGATAGGRAPVNLAFLGTAWSEPQLLGFAYDYEQATLHRVPPTEVNDFELATGHCAAG